MFLFAEPVVVFEVNSLWQDCLCFAKNKILSALYGRESIRPDEKQSHTIHGATSFSLSYLIFLNKRTQTRPECISNVI